MKRTSARYVMLAVAAGLLLAANGSVSAWAKASASCTAKAAEGTGSSEENAKFQVYEALLQATDWGAWASWMSSGKTPGYRVNTVKYKCAKGGLGMTCHGQTTICKI
jgi:hypothetical protein